MNCLSCGAAAKKKYCSVQCQQNLAWEQRKAELLASGIDSTINCKQAKRYILETRGHQCEICKGTEWQGQPMPLTLDHIDGNSENSLLTNLRFICPNCDRLTPFFGAKNKGNGRAWRRQRYQDGKSY